MYWRTADVSAWGAHRRTICRYIGAAGMNAPPTQGPVLVVKVHHPLQVLQVLQALQALQALQVLQTWQEIHR
jgi:hypothetical protein